MLPMRPFVLDASHAAGPGPQHSHREAQLVHAHEGAIQVHTPDGRWVVPPHRAVWVPAEVPHSVSSSLGYRLLTLYVPAEAACAPVHCYVVALDVLARELLLEASRFGSEYETEGPEARLIAVLLDRVSRPHKQLPMHLPMPSSAELRRVTSKLTEEPGLPLTLPELARSSAMTPRTLARRFRAETGMTFGQWRQQLRLIVALERLACGESVTAVALDVGYSDVSSFIANFGRAFGTTPKRYFSSAR